MSILCVCVCVCMLTWSDGIDEEDASGGGLMDEVRQLVCLLQGVEVSPACPVLVIVLGGVQVGVHTPFTHSAGMVWRQRHSGLLAYQMSCVFIDDGANKLKTAVQGLLACLVPP